MEKVSQNKEEELIEKIKIYLKDYFINESTGHDYYHALRVEKLSKKIIQKEGGNSLICRVASLLHDLIDRKIKNSINPNCEKFEDFFNKLEISSSDKNEILYIINNLSFSNMIGNKNIKITKEFSAVSDADKIDALGAIGIARAFSYGGKHGDPLFDPDIKSNLNITQEEYKDMKRKTSVINHFDEKLLKLDQYIITKTGKEIAKPRIEILKKFKEQFLEEWNFE